MIAQFLWNGKGKWIKGQKEQFYFTSFICMPENFWPKALAQLSQ